MSSAPPPRCANARAAYHLHFELHGADLLPSGILLGLGVGDQASELRQGLVVDHQCVDFHVVVGLYFFDSRLYPPYRGEMVKERSQSGY